MDPNHSHGDRAAEAHAPTQQRQAKTIEPAANHSRFAYTTVVAWEQIPRIYLKVKLVII